MPGSSLFRFPTGVLDIRVLAAGLFIPITIFAYNVARNFGRPIIIGLETLAGGELKDPEILIVAVHGLGAHPDFTWTARGEILDTNSTVENQLDPHQKPKIKPGRVNWLSDSRFLQNDFPMAVVMRFAHNANWIFMAPWTTARETGLNLLAEVKNQTKHFNGHLPPILFVGHSFGGLVIKEAMVDAATSKQYEEILKATCGIIFLGTPHHGSQLSTPAIWAARLLGFLGSNTMLLKSLQSHEASLTDLQERFVGVISDLPDNVMHHVFCFRETLDTRMKGLPVGRIVSRDSASIDGCRNDKMDADHSGLNKYSSTSDNNYQKIKRAIHDIVEFSKEYSYARGCNAQVISRLAQNPFPGEIPETLQTTPNNSENPCFTWLEENPQYREWKQMLTSSPKFIWCRNKWTTQVGPRVVRQLRDWRSLECHDVVSCIYMSNAESPSMQIVLASIVGQLVRKRIDDLDIKIMDQLLITDLRNPSSAQEETLWHLVGRLLNANTKRNVSLVLEGIDCLPLQELERFMVNLCHRFQEAKKEFRTKSEPDFCMRCIVISSKPASPHVQDIDGISCIDPAQKDEDNIDRCLQNLVPAADTGIQKSLRDNIKTPVSGTCDWVKSEVDKFLARVSSEKTPKSLVLRGGPGSGKSVLSKFLIDYLEQRPDVVVCYFIFKDADPATSQPIAAMRMLVHQLLSKNRGLYRHIGGFHEQEPQGNRQWTLEVLLGVFKDMMSDEKSKSTIIIIDALNECDDEYQKRPGASGWQKDFKPRADLMEKLKLLGPGIVGHFIITTQHFEELSVGFPRSKTIQLDTHDEVKDSITNVINHHVHKFFHDYLQQLRESETSDCEESSGDEQDHQRHSERPSRYEALRKEYEDLQPVLEKKLKEKAGHMFLWVSLFMNNLEHLASTSPGKILEELEALPTDLMQLYIEMFSRRLKDHKTAICQKLPWILFAQRPLRREELQDALAMQDCRGKPEPALQKWRSGNLVADLNRNFGSLVVVERSPSWVRLFHSSLRGALLGKSMPLCERLMEICKSPVEEHAEIAATCLDYLCLPHSVLSKIRTVKLEDDDPSNHTEPLLRKFPFLRESKLLEEFPFLTYAATNWAYHARAAGESHPKVVKAFERLVAMKDNLEVAFQIYIRSLPHVHGKDIDLPHKLSEWGIEKLAIKYVEENHDFNQTNEFGNHIFHSASWNGLLNLVKVLEEKGVKADLMDGVEQTALHHAAQTGQLEVVDYLISKGLELNSSGTRQWTPLHYAASGRHLHVITALLDKGANARKTDNHNRTASQVLLAYLDPMTTASLGGTLDDVLARLENLEKSTCKTGEGLSSGCEYVVVNTPSESSSEDNLLAKTSRSHSL